MHIHSPYEIVKQEPNASPDHSGVATSDLLFSSQFGIPNFMPTNNNHETHNHNLARCTKGRTLTADRKRPYPCNICPSRFGSKMELEEHQNSHTGQKPFECDVCKARFNRRSTLWNHKRIHSDAKPFVCSVCQMTFKWKNSLKCHKEMHLRKNESSTVLDADLRQLTYATAAKRTKESQCIEGSLVQHISPLISTPSTKKKSKSNSSASSTSSSNTGMSNNSMDGSPHHSLGPTATIDIDAASLDTLVHQNNGNILVQLCSEVDPNLGRHSLLGTMEDTQNLLSQSHLFTDIKGEIIYPTQQSHMNCQPQPHQINVNVQIPIVGNMFNFRGLGQTLPSVHHLTSTSIPSVSVQMDYTGEQSQYVAVSQQDMMPTVSYNHALDQCVVIATGQDYMPNFDYSLINGVQVPSYDASPPSQVDQSGQNQVMGGNNFEEKAIPHDRW